MKQVYCAKCGTKLRISRRALPEYQTIIDIVEHHECPDDPVEIDLEPVDTSKPVSFSDDDKFVQKLNELAPPKPQPPLQDRRPSESVKSTAPETLLDQLSNLQNSTPAHDLSEEPAAESE